MRRLAVGALLLALAVGWAADPGFHEGFEAGLGGAKPYYDPPDGTRLELVSQDAPEGKQYLRVTLPGKRSLEGCSITADGLQGGRLATVGARVRGKGELWLCLISSNGWLYSPTTAPLTGRWQDVRLTKVLMAADTSLGIFFISKTVQPGAIFEVDDVRVTLGEPPQVYDAEAGPWRFEAEDYSSHAQYLTSEEGALGGKALTHRQYLAAVGFPFPRTARPVTVYARVRAGSLKETYRLVTTQGGNEESLTTLKPQKVGEWQWLRFPAVTAGEVSDTFGVQCWREADAEGAAALDAVALATGDPRPDDALTRAPDPFATRPLALVGRTDAPPALDGRADDDCWRDCVTCADFVGLSSLVAAQADTRVRLCYDAAHLYLLAECAEPILNAAQQRRHEFAAKIKQRDGDVYTDDSVVVLLDRDGSGKRVYDFTVNALGTVADAVTSGPDMWESRDLKWNSGARAAGQIGDDRWTAEVAIPWDALGGTPPAGTPWKVCLGRIAIARKEITSWNPCRRGFHDPIAMGTLVFGDGATGLALSAPPALQPGRNALTAELTPGAHPVGITLTASAGSGPLTRRSQQFAPLAGEPAKAIHTFDVSQEGDLRLAFGALNAATLEPVYLTPVWPRTARSAVATVDLDCDGAYELTLNDEVIGRGAQADGVQVKAPLSKGANVFALRLEQGTGAVRIAAPGASITSESWRIAPAHTQNATVAATDDGGWVMARKVGEHPQLGTVVGEPGKAVVLRRTLLWEKTRIWPTPEPAFTLARGAAQHFNVIVDGLAGKRLQGWATYLATPPEYEIVGASGFYGGSGEQPRFHCTQLGEREVGGRTMRVARVSADKPVLAGRHYIMGLFNAFVRYREAAGEPKSPEATFVYWSEANGGSVSEAPQSFRVRLLPKLRGKQPRRLTWQLWGGWLTNMDDLTMREEVLKASRLAGINDLSSGDRWTSDTGAKYGIHDTLEINFQSWSVNVAPYLQSHPEARLITGKGEPDGKRMCLTALLGKDWKAVEAQLRKLIAANRPHTLDYDYEYEPFAGPHSCYCPRCLAAFRRAAKLDAGLPLDAATIKQQHSRAWIDFMCRRTARLFARFRESIHRIAPGTRFSAYSGYQTPANPEEYGLDWRQIGELKAVDQAGCGYGRPVEAVRATVAALKGIPLLCGEIVVPYDVSSLIPVSPLTKAALLRRSLDATGGVLVFDRLSMDGRCWLALAEASRLVATYEPLFVKGRRSGLPGLDGTQVQAVSDGRTTLVCVLNETGKPATFALRLPAAAGSGREFYSGRKVAAGATVPCTVAPGDAAVCVLVARSPSILH